MYSYIVPSSRFNVIEYEYNSGIVSITQKDKLYLKCTVLKSGIYRLSLRSRINRGDAYIKVNNNIVSHPGCSVNDVQSANVFCSEIIKLNANDKLEFFSNVANIAEEGEISYNIELL